MKTKYILNRIFFKLTEVLPYQLNPRLKQFRNECNKAGLAICKNNFEIYLNHRRLFSDVVNNTFEEFEELPEIYIPEEVNCPEFIDEGLLDDTWKWLHEQWS